VNAKLAIARLESMAQKLDSDEAALQKEYGNVTKGSIRASKRWDALALHAILKEVARLGQERQAGRTEALNAVFQINGPSRAITQLKKKWGIDQ
jgi:hypothetical protein